MVNYSVNVKDIVSALGVLGDGIRTKEVQDYILKYHADGKVPENYASEDTFRAAVRRRIEEYCPQAKDFNKDKYQPIFLRVSRGRYSVNKERYESIDKNSTKELPPLEQYEDFSIYIEGSIKLIEITKYERNTKARNKCINYYGCRCFVCSFDFKKFYGEMGNGYIHVHHITPLSEIGREYIIDPIKDLRPICPNCHSMIHCKSPAITIEELKDRLTMSSAAYSSE